MLRVASTASAPIVSPFIVLACPAAKVLPSADVAVPADPSVFKYSEGLDCVGWICRYVSAPALLIFLRTVKVSNHPGMA